MMSDIKYAIRHNTDDLATLAQKYSSELDTPPEIGASLIGYAAILNAGGSTSPPPCRSVVHVGQSCMSVSFARHDVLLPPDTLPTRRRNPGARRCRSRRELCRGC
jgi:hypothetical protein